YLRALDIIWYRGLLFSSPPSPLHRVERGVASVGERRGEDERYKFPLAKKRACCIIDSVQKNEREE
ncbi:hypothetical protein ACFLZ2_01495, partial [Candidatus Margulisiibacteriota bacterium]